VLTYPVQEREGWNAQISGRVGKQIKSGSPAHAPIRVLLAAVSREDEENIAASLTKCVVAREGIDRSAGYHGSGYTD